MTTQMLDVMLDLGLLTSGEMNKISNIFGRIEIAEEEIEEARHEWPDKSVEIWNAFCICPSPVIPDVSPNKLFRYHYRQLMRMIAMEEDLDMPTGIEAACMVIMVANKVPIRLEIVIRILGDFETAEAFNVEEIQTNLRNVGTQYDDDFRKAYRRAYKRVNEGMTRASRFAARLKEGRRPPDEIP